MAKAKPMPPMNIPSWKRKIYKCSECGQKYSEDEFNFSRGMCDYCTGSKK